MRLKKQPARRIMSNKKNLIQWQTHKGEKVSVGEVAITPESQALSIRWPYGGFVWNRPVGVLVEREGRTEHIPIVDVTRMAQVGFLGLTLAFSTLFMIFTFKKRRRIQNGRGS
jgi:hypothetical protein